MRQSSSIGITCKPLAGVDGLVISVEPASGAEIAMISNVNSIRVGVVNMGRGHLFMMNDMEQYVKKLCLVEML